MGEFRLIVIGFYRHSPVLLTEIHHKVGAVSARGTGRDRMPFQSPSSWRHRVTQKAVDRPADWCSYSLLEADWLNQRIDVASNSAAGSIIWMKLAGRVSQ